MLYKNELFAPTLLGTPARNLYVSSTPVVTFQQIYTHMNKSLLEIKNFHYQFVLWATHVKSNPQNFLPDDWALHV